MLSNIEVLKPIVKEGKKHAWQTYHVLLSDSLDRDQTIAKLRENGIGTNYGAQCMPEQFYYKKKYNLDSQLLFPNAYRAYTKGLALPLYELLTKEDIIYISKQINKI
jgi:perosamine synthetase